MPRFVVEPAKFRSAAASTISGLPAYDVRDLRRRKGVVERPETAGWTEYSPLDVARLLLIATLRDAGFQLQTAAEIATDEMAGAVLFHATQIPDAIVDDTGNSVFARNQSYRVKAGFELAGMRAVAGPLFVWGPEIEAGCYSSLEHALDLASQKLGRRPVMFSVVDLAGLGSILHERAIVLGFLRKVSA